MASLLSGPLAPLLGVIVGVIVSAWLAASLDRKRWQRDWFTSRASRLEAYNADVCRAVDQQHLLLSQSASAARGERSPVSPERILAADATWRDVLARRYVYALPEMQNVLAAYDEAREVCVVAVNSRDTDMITSSEQARDVARVAVFDAVQATVNDVNGTLAFYVLPRRYLLWVLITGRRLGPLAPLPSDTARDLKTRGS